MEVLILQIFVSFVLVFGSLLMFVYSIRQRDHEHNERLALFPIEADTIRRPVPASGQQRGKNK